MAIEVENIYGELSPRDQLLQVAADICRVETDSLQRYGCLATWRAEPSIFEMPLVIQDANLRNSTDPNAYQVTKATLSVIDADGGLSTYVSRDMPQYIEDPFATDLIEAFSTFYTHHHELCLEALKQKHAREAIQTEQARLRDLQAMPTLYVTDKRRIIL